MDNLIGLSQLPLLPQPGTQGAYDGKASLAAVKEICKVWNRIEGALALVSQRIFAMVPDTPDFFACDNGMAKLRGEIWPTVKKCNHIMFGLLTDHPKTMKATLPQDWIGDGFKNVVLGTRVSDQEHLVSRLSELRSIPARFRMLVVGQSVDASLLTNQLGGIHWVVMTGDISDAQQAAALAEICRDAKLPFAVLPTGGDGAPDESPQQMAEWQGHPFGHELQLGLPPITGIKGLVDEIRLLCAEPPSAKPASHPTAVRRVAGQKANPQGAVEIVSKPTIMLPQSKPEPVPALVDAEIIPAESRVVPQVLAEPAEGVTMMLQAMIESEGRSLDFEELDKQVRANLRSFVLVGLALIQIRDGELWRKGGFLSWAAYCQDIGARSKSYANRLILSANIICQISKVVPVGTTLPTAEYQVRPLSVLNDPAQLADTWLLALKYAGGSQPTAALVKKALAELKPAEEMPKPRSNTNGKDPIMKAIGVLRREAVKRQSQKVDAAIAVLERLLVPLGDCAASAAKKCRLNGVAA